jgi:hypothetical protein
VLKRHTVGLAFLIRRSQLFFLKMCKRKIQKHLFTTRKADAKGLLLFSLKMSCGGTASSDAADLFETCKLQEGERNRRAKQDGLGCKNKGGSQNNKKHFRRQFVFIQ